MVYIDANPLPIIIPHMKIFACSVALVMFVCGLSAQTKSYHAVRTNIPPVIDGFGDDAAWMTASIIAGFVQREPLEGQHESERTEVKILYDEQYLYVFAMMYDSQPESITARLARRDDIPESDWFGIGFDSYYDKQTAFIFILLASGSKADFLSYNDGRDEDYSWDPVWESETKILPNGWSAEMRIPLSQLRFSEGSDVWGINIARRISRKQEETNWNLMSKQQEGFVSQFGTMTGMSSVQLPRRLEILPYAVGSSEHYPQTPDRVKIEKHRPDAGVDIKYSISSNFTLDATLNPDFAQVEADPTVLNLTTFETFYPEKRPFFIEGTQILRFVTFGGDFGPGLFYSRRIGKAISVNLPADGEVITEEPRTTTILGAAKFSGKTENGTSIGILTALTDEEEFSYRDTMGNVHTLRAEPRTSYNLFRMKQDFLGNSNIGAAVTATARDNRNPAYTAGMDWDVKFDNNNYRLNGFFAHSRITTPFGEFRQGNAGKANIGRVSGEWIYSLSYDFTSRRYFINDIGFFNSPNDYGFAGNVTYRNYMPGNYFRSYNIGIVPHIRWNYDNLTLFKEMRLNFNSRLINYWSFSGAMSYSHGEKDPYDPRGYGVYNFPSSYFVRAEIETDNRKPVVINVEENFRRNEQGATITNTGLSLTVRPTTAMEYQLTLEYGTDRNLNAYADTLTDVLIKPSPLAIYGRRNVDRTDATLRSSILFTHNLSLQIYNQFFWAKGMFRNFSILQESGNLHSYNFTRNVDFNRTSLISNVVLRWEYREGSTFYFVWSHGRAFSQRRIAGIYDSGLGDNLDNTFLASPDNVYVVKVSYWMSL